MNKKNDNDFSLKKLIKIEEMGVLFGVIVLSVIITLINPKFLNIANISSIVENFSHVAIAGLAVTMVFVSGGLDLSLGSMMAFSSVIAAILMKAGVFVPLAVLIGILAAGIFGLLNGVLIVKYKIPSFIVTLGTMYIGRGVVQAITRGRPIYPLPESFGVLGNTYLFKLPLAGFILLVLAYIANFVLKNTSYGRSLYAIGGNLETAKLSGINTEFIQGSTYVLSAMMAGFSGIILTSKMLSAQTSLGTGWEFKIIAAVIIGGTSMMGGIGTIAGTILGAILMAIIENGMVLMRVSVFWQQIVIGSIIILAVGIDIYRRKKAGLKV